MKRAEYSADDEGHFGLAKRYYSHFTSPIRRYPDLVLHRQLAALLAGDRAAQPSLDDLRAVAASSTKTEFRADQAERALVEIKKFRWLEERLAAGDPPELDGVVVKCLPYGAFVELPSLMLDGMAHVSTLSSHFVRFDRDRERLVAPGEFDLGPGSRVRVLVTAVHFDDRRIDFKVTDFNPSTEKHEKHGEEKTAPETRPSKGLSSKDIRHEERRARRGKHAKDDSRKHLPRAARKAEKPAPPAKRKGGPASPPAAKKPKFPTGKKTRPSAKPRFAKRKPSSRKR